MTEEEKRLPSPSAFTPHSPQILLQTVEWKYFYSSHMFRLITPEFGWIRKDKKRRQFFSNNPHITSNLMQLAKRNCEVECNFHRYSCIRSVPSMVCPEMCVCEIAKTLIQHVLGLKNSTMKMFNRIQKLFKSTKIPFKQ